MTGLLSVFLYYHGSSLIGEGAVSGAMIGDGKKNGASQVECPIDFQETRILFLGLLGDDQVLDLLVDRAGQDVA